jgi:hypothetical protein
VSSISCAMHVTTCVEVDRLRCDQEVIEESGELVALNQVIRVHIWAVVMYMGSCNVLELVWLRVSFRLTLSLKYNAQIRRRASGDTW